MRSINQTLHMLQDQHRRRRARLPWAELEAEAARQGCSAADIFFDRAGRPVPGLSFLHGAPVGPTPNPAGETRRVRAPAPRQPTFYTRSKRA
jgi:hypothetical protein